MIFKKPENNNKPQVQNNNFSKEQRAFGNKLINILSKPENIDLKNNANFIYSNDIGELIKNTYNIRLLGLFAIFVGLAFTIVLIIFAPLLSIFGGLFIFIGFYLYFSPYSIVKFTLMQKMKSIEQDIYLKRYDILRQFYYNLKLYNDAFHISNPEKTKKENPTLYMILKALTSNPSPAFYEKFLGVAELFKDNFDLSQFFKEISEKTKGKEFEAFFLIQEEENKESSKTTVTERAVMKQTVTTMMVLAVGMIIMFGTLGGYMQIVFSTIYHFILTTTAGAGASTSSLGSSLSIFQILAEVPPVYLMDFGVFGILIILAIKMKKDNNSMFGWWYDV